MDRESQPLHPHATYYSPSRPSGHGQRQHSHKKRSWKKAVIYGGILLLLVGGTYVALRPGKKPVVLAHRKETTVKITKPPVTIPASNPALVQLSQSINSVISQNSDIDFSVNLINLNTGSTEHYGSNDIFQAASTAKIIASIDWLHQVEIGQQTMAETVGPDTAANDIDQMITVSNDPDWKAIEAQLGYTNLQNYAAGLGLVDYEAGNNSLTSGDIALILQKLWDGTVLNKADTQLLLGYMENANYRGYIVPAIPAGDTVYHKIGFYETYLNDAAIVTHGNQAFVIVIFTNGDDDAYPWPARATDMQEITKAALQYYLNQ